MNKIIKFIVTYAIWVADLILALWFAYLCRTTLIGIFALFYTGNVAYANAVNFIDKAFTLLLGLGWLIFMIIVEHHYRAGIDNDGQLQRLSSVTGWLLLSIFIVDLLLAWVQGIGADYWLRWLVLLAELAVGITLLVLSNTRFKSK